MGEGWVWELMRRLEPLARAAVPMALLRAGNAGRSHWHVTGGSFGVVEAVTEGLERA